MKTASGYQKKLKLMKKAVDASNKDKKTPFEGKRILRLTDLPEFSKGGGIAIKGTGFKGVR